MASTSRAVPEIDQALEVPGEPLMEGPAVQPARTAARPLCAAIDDTPLPIAPGGGSRAAVRNGARTDQRSKTLDAIGSALNDVVVARPRVWQKPQVPRAAREPIE